MESYSIYLCSRGKRAGREGWPLPRWLASCLSCPLRSLLPPGGHGKSWMHFPSHLSAFVPAFPSVWGSQTLHEPPGVDAISYRKSSLLPPGRTHLIVSFYLLLERFYPSALCLLEPLLACSSPPLDQQLIGGQAWSDTCYLSPAFPLPRCWALWSAATGEQETGFACALQHIHRCLATTILTWVLETKGTLGVAHFHPSLPTGGHRKTSHTSALPFNVPEHTEDTLFLSSCGK